jgi:hypothetical protein
MNPLLIYANFDNKKKGRKGAKRQHIMFQKIMKI